MLIKRFLITFVMIASFLMAASCAPAIEAVASSEPGASAGNQESQAEPSTQNGQPGMKTAYADNTYKFKIDYPADFVFRPLSAEKLKQLEPPPVASFIYMNPVIASSDLGDLEPADLEIRIYNSGQETSIENWLTSAGLLPAGTTSPKRFQTTNISGVEVCPSTMIAPGCSYFFVAGAWVYQLRPASLEGENMINSFMVIP